MVVLCVDIDFLCVGFFEFCGYCGYVVYGECVSVDKFIGKGFFESCGGSCFESIVF